MQKSRLLLGTVTALCMLISSATAQQPTFTTFDLPGSIQTQASNINAAGAITGYYAENCVAHGFLRAPDGTITTFDPPGTSPLLGTYPSSINPQGRSRDITTTEVLWRTVFSALATRNARASQ
jgi:hypothetical protein